MSDVAHLAGVSHQTVSRVINGSDNVRPETRERVLRAIRQLGYRPNTAARALVTRRSATVGVIGTEDGFWGPTSIQRATQAAARDEGFFVSSVNLHSVTREELAAAVDHLRDQSVEGIILVAAHDEALAVARAQESSVPLVVVEGDLSQAELTVGVNQEAGARMATRHLLDLGHREIVHVTGPMHWTEARARLQGWRAEMYAAGLRPAEPVLGDWTAASGYEAGLRIAKTAGVTAVFAANDQMALGVLRALSEAEIEVPGEVSVVGFDDIPEAAYFIPPLTTVRQDFAAVGRRAIQILRAALGQDERVAGLPRLIEPELIERRSTHTRRTS